MEKDQSNKSEEVSLPGADGAEPTIIETLNKNTISNTIEDQKENKVENNKSELNQEESIQSKSNLENLPQEVEEEQEDSIKINEYDDSKTENVHKSDNILEIQSHLIETFDKNFSVSENIDIDGVTIKEIPAKPEEFQRTSQIETETSPKSVIEIEPSIPKIHIPIRLDLDISSNKRESKLRDSLDLDEDDKDTDTNINNNNINVKNINKEEKKLDTAKEDKIEISNKFIENEKDKIESSHIENNNLLATETTNLEFQNNSDSFSINIKNENEKLLEAEKQNIENNVNITPKQQDITNEKDKKESNPHKNLQEEIIIKSDKVFVVPELEQESIKVASNQENNFEKSSKEHQEQNIADKNKEDIPVITSNNNNLDLDIGINGLINCTTPLEEEEKKKLLDSLPQLDTNIDPHKLSIEAKKEYYQSLRDYLDKYQSDKPPIPLQTYRWEDLRRAKEKGGYPWTHLYKRPLGSDEEPEIVLLLRKSQEFHFHKQYQNNHQTSESPKSLKKVRIHDQVLVKETERYISDLSDTEDLSSKTSSPSSTAVSTESEEDNKSALSESCASDSVSEGKKSKFSKLKGILKRKTGEKNQKKKEKKSQDNKQKKQPIEVKESTESKETITISSASPSPSPLPSDIPDSSEILSDEYLTATTTTPTESEIQSDQETKTRSDEPSPKKGKCCHPIMDKIKTMADKQFKKRHIKKIPLKGDEKIILEEEQKILKLRESPKADRGEIPKFVEKQDSEEIVEIVQLEESPSLKRKDGIEPSNSILVPDEIIEIPPQSTVKVQISQDKQQAIDKNMENNVEIPDSPPRKTLRKMKDHVYEEIDSKAEISIKIDEILELASVEALKQSLAAQDKNVFKDMEGDKKLPLDRMGSSEEEIIEKNLATKVITLAPISSIDSTSSDEQEKRISLSTVAEESDASSITDGRISKEPPETITIIEEEEKDLELKPALKKEPSPGPNGIDKKVTFSHVEDESEPLREDLETPDALKNLPNRWKDMA